MPEAARASAPRDGLIIAAGMGSRLATRTGGSGLKPLLEVAGRPLILRAIDGLGLAGCTRVVIVTGYAADELTSAITTLYAGPVEVVFVFNPEYQKQNGISVLSARSELKGTFLLTMSDHIVAPVVMKLAGAHPPVAQGATLLVDSKIDRVFDLDDATKVRAEGGRIAAIGKTLTDYNCIDCGVFVCTQGLMDALSDARSSRGDASLSEGVQTLAGRNLMHVLDIGDGEWQDVDTPDMLREAERLIARWDESSAR